MKSTAYSHPDMPSDLSALTARELSLKARLAVVLLLLVSAGMTVALSSLLLTESALPLRTMIAFAVMIVIGLSWVGFALWLLSTRRVLLAADAVIASRMALCFCSLFFVGALALSLGTGKAAGFGAAVVGLVMTAAAALMLRRANRKHAALLARRAELERLLQGSAA
ncbi:MAG: hypothetical protein ABIT83_17170 [Massilia sp.]